MRSSPAVLQTGANTASFPAAPGAVERCECISRKHLFPRTSHTLLLAAPLALWKSPFLAVQRKVIRERTGQGGSGSGFKGWRTSLTSRSSSVTIRIYSRRRKDRRLFLSNLLIKSCQSCPNANRFMALDIKGRKYPVIKFMGLDRKPN